MNAMIVLDMLLRAIRERGTMGAFIVYETEGRDWFMRFTWDVVAYPQKPATKDVLTIKGLIIGVAMFEAEIWGYQNGGKAFPDLFVPLDPPDNSFRVTQFHKNSAHSIEELEHHFMMAKLQSPGFAIQ